MLLLLLDLFSVGCPLFTAADEGKRKKRGFLFSIVGTVFDATVASDGMMLSFLYDFFVLQSISVGITQIGTWLQSRHLVFHTPTYESQAI